MTDETTTEDLPPVGGSCESRGPVFCSNQSMWIQTSDKVDPTGLIQATIDELPEYICPYEDEAVYFYSPEDERFYAKGSICDAYWDPYNCPPEVCGGLVQPDGPTPGAGSREMKWYHYLALGSMGAGAGYLLFKDRGSGTVAAVVGGGLSVVAVMAFRPGGWLRSAETAGLRR